MPSLSISIVIPARNEEHFLPACLEAIRASAAIAKLNPEIIVVLNRCTDRTEEIASSHGCRVVKEDAKNLSKIRNAGVRAATGGLIMTIDADSYMSKAMLRNIVSTMETGRYVGGGVAMYPERLSLGIALTFMCLAPIALWYRIGGGLYFFWKEDFEAISGFDENLLSAEDIDFARRLKAHGKLSGRGFKILIRSFILTSCRKFDKFGDWYFLARPIQMIKLLKGKNRDIADKIWYDFPRD